jgi:hypothetical protein
MSQEEKKGVIASVGEGAYCKGEVSGKPMVRDGAYWCATGTEER